jgi:hypothetical protein
MKSQMKSPYINVILKISKSSTNDFKSDFVKSSIKSWNTLLMIHPGNTWHRLTSAGNRYFLPRSGHSSVYVETEDSIYFYGGFDLNRVSGKLLQFRFGTGRWRKYDRRAGAFRDIQTALAAKRNRTPKKITFGEKVLTKVE